MVQDSQWLLKVRHPLNGTRDPSCMAPVRSPTVTIILTNFLRVLRRDELFVDYDGRL